jgi:hypothetical protein
MYLLAITDLQNIINVVFKNSLMSGTQPTTALGSEDLPLTFFRFSRHALVADLPLNCFITLFN